MFTRIPRSLLPVISSLVAACAVSLVAINPPEASAQAVAVAKAKTKSVNGVSCARLGAKWAAGRFVGGGSASGRSFISSDAEAKVLRAKARRAKGPARAKLLAQAKTLEDRAAVGRLLCTAPVGTVAVDVASTKTAAGTPCAKPGAEWSSGKFVTSKVVAGKRIFLSDQAQAQAARAKAKALKGKKPAVARARARLLAQATTFDKAAREGAVKCRASRAAVAALSIDLRGAVGAAVIGTPSSATSRTVVRGARPSHQSGAAALQALMPSGELRDAVSGGYGDRVRILTVVAGPDGAMYIIFDGSAPLQNQANKAAGYCVLARVERDSTNPVCVEPVEDGRNAMVPPPTVDYDASPSVQFDGSGRAYYLAYSTSSAWSPTPPDPCAADMMPIYRYANGVRTRVGPVWLGASLWSWLVLRDGSLLVAGSDSCRGNNDVIWVRHVRTDGSVVDVGRPGGFMAQFPDGLAYVGLSWTMPNFVGGIARLDPATSTVESKWWMSNSMYDDGRGFYFDSGTGSGAEAARAVTTTSGSVFGAIPSAYGVERPMQKYYPTPSLVTSQVKAITAYDAAGDVLLIAGRTTTGDYVLVRHVEATGAESVLIGASEGLEVKRIRYSASRNAAYFHGVRRSSGQRVVGTVDLGNGAVSVSAPSGVPGIVAMEVFN